MGWSEEVCPSVPTLPSWVCSASSYVLLLSLPLTLLLDPAGEVIKSFTVS